MTRIHVYPLEDLRDHVVSGDRECWCHPTPEEDGALLLHHAMDQREKYETGEIQLQ